MVKIMVFKKRKASKSTKPLKWVDKVKEDKELDQALKDTFPASDATAKY